MSTIIVIITLDIPADIMVEATLSYIGLGVQPLLQVGGGYD